MLRRFVSLTRRDLRLIWRNYYFHFAMVIMLLFALGIRFIFPAEFNVKPGVVVWDTTTAQAVQQHIVAHAAETGTADRLVVVDSAAAFEEALAAGNRVGIKAVGGLTLELIELTYQGDEHDRIKQLLSADMQALAAQISGPGSGYPQFETRVLRPGTAPPRIPFNHALVPFGVLTEAAMVGLFIAAAMLYSEKDERSLRAYRVSPAGVAEYILARGAAMGVLGVVFTVWLSLLTVGFIGNWLVLIPLVFVSAMVVTMLTLVVANMFENLSQFIYPASLMLFVLSMPMVPYFSPNVSLPWIRALPTHALLFALREAYFMPDSTASLMALGQLALTALIVFPLAVWTFRRQLIARDV